MGRVVTEEEEKQVSQSDLVEEERIRWVCVTALKSSFGWRETL